MSHVGNAYERHNILRVSKECIQCCPPKGRDTTISDYLIHARS